MDNSHSSLSLPLTRCPHPSSLVTSLISVAMLSISTHVHHCSLLPAKNKVPEQRVSNPANMMRHYLPCCCSQAHTKTQPGVVGHEDEHQAVGQPHLINHQTNGMIIFASKRYIMPMVSIHLHKLQHSLHHVSPGEHAGLQYPDLVIKGTNI